MKKIIIFTRLIALLTICAIEAGCGAMTPTMGLNSHDQAKLKNLALIQVSEPEIRIYSHSGLPGIGGAIGSIAAENAKTFEKNANKEYQGALDAKNIKLGDSMARMMQTELVKKGFNVTYLADQFIKATPPGKTDLEDFSKIKTDADAVLFVALTYVWYYNSMLSTHYVPFVGVTAKLIDAHTRKPIYIHNFLAGYEVQVNSQTNIALDGKYKYDSAEKIMQKFDESVEGIMDGEKKIAEMIANHLKGSH